DFVVMSEGAAMFTGGPPLVKAATGEDVTKEELGGARMCAEIAGTAHAVVPDDGAALALARRYLAYFPSRRGDALPEHWTDDSGPRRLDDLVEVMSPNDRRPYDIHDVIERLVDRDSFLEIQPGYGRGLVVGLAFLGGRAVALLGNNPSYQSGA